MSARRDGAADKRRLILDAAIRVFAREGYHRCRVSDIAREANVAYGLVYHYFRSKDEVLDTLFTERWTLLLDAIAEIIRKAQDAGAFRSDFSAEFATLCFYGAIEQLLTAWIFGELTRSDEEFEQAKNAIVETICDGLAVRSGVSA